MTSTPGRPSAPRASPSSTEPPASSPTPAPAFAAAPSPVRLATAAFLRSNPVPPPMELLPPLSSVRPAAPLHLRLDPMPPDPLFSWPPRCRTKGAPAGATIIGDGLPPDRIRRPGDPRPRRTSFLHAKSARHPLFRLVLGQGGRAALLPARSARMRASRVDRFHSTRLGLIHSAKAQPPLGPSARTQLCQPTVSSRPNPHCALLG
nr:vegetative cell wall protein gp1 [Aegilops tauschii subsp. strangulata]